MKKRVFSLLLILALLAQLLVFPASAATPQNVYQWLVNHVKQYGDYDAGENVYYIVYYMFSEERGDTYQIIYDQSDGDLILFTDVRGHVELDISRSAKAPFTGFYYNPNTYLATYSVNPKDYTAKSNLHFSDFEGASAYRNQVDNAFNESLKWILEKTNNLLVVCKSGLTVKDLGFTNWNRHIIHEWDDPVLIKAGACGTENVYQVKCLVCGETEQYEEPLEHQWGDPIVFTEPTCTKQGRSYRVCTRCGASTAANIIIPALGHSWKVAEVLTPGGDKTHGKAVFECSRCHETSTEKLCGKKLFKDMPAEKHWAHFGIDWALEHGITNGIDDTHFGPDMGCTRGQVVTFLWRAAG